MECIAHRGFAAVYPENTAAAVHAAAEVADAVEIDLRRCGSGEPVAVHDETVDRVTDRSGPVADYTAEELGDMSVYGTEAGVPTFAEVVSVVPPEVTLHVELKEVGLGPDVRDIAQAAHCPVVVSSFHEEALAEIRGDLPLAFAFSGLETDEALETARSLDCVAVHPNKYGCTPRFVERAHDAGLAVNVWTIDDADETRDLRSVGVDGVFVDAPEYCPGRVDEDGEDDGDRDGEGAGADRDGDGRGA